MNNITILKSVLNALDAVAVSGYENHIRLIGSMNDIQKVIKSLEEEKPEAEEVNEEN